MAELFKDNGFKFCPNCSLEQLEFTLKNMHCKNCDYILYFNTAASIGVIIWHIVEAQSQVLLVLRATEPQQNCYDLPGGFVDPGESLEQALVRELNEELGADLPKNLSPPQYFLSASNNYYYRQNMYPVCDAFFHAQLLEDVKIIAADDVKSYEWCKADEIPFAHLAFPSTKLALQRWRALQN